MPVPVGLLDNVNIYCYSADLEDHADRILGQVNNGRVYRVRQTPQGWAVQVPQGEQERRADVAWIVAHGAADTEMIGTPIQREIWIGAILDYLIHLGVTYFVDSCCQAQSRLGVAQARNLQRRYFSTIGNYGVLALAADETLDDWWDENMMGPLE